MSSITKISKELQGILNETLVSTCFQQLDKYQSFIDETQESIKGKEKFVNDKLLIDSPIELKKTLHKALETKKEILSIIEKYFPDDNVEDFEGGIDPYYRISNFNQRMEDWLAQFPERKVEFQKKERFSDLETDSFYIKQGKRFKRIFYWITILPKKFRNLLLKLFKKTPKQIHYWRHSIPERKINKWYYKYQTAEKLIPLCESADLKILQSLRSILSNEEILDLKVLKNFLPIDDLGNLKKETEEKFDLKEASDDKEDKNHEEISKVDAVSTIVQENASEIKSVKVTPVTLNAPGLKTDLEKQSALVLKEVEESYSKSHDRVGTFELPAFRFNNSRLQKKEEQLKHKYKVTTKNWNNAHRVELFDWKLDLELYSAIYKILILIIDLKVQMNSKIQFLDPYIQEIIAYQQDIKKRSSVKFKDKKELRKFIVESKYDARKILQKKARELSELMINQNFSGLLDKLEVSVESIIDSLPEKSWVVGNQGQGPVNESDINLISPSDLIFFESFGLLQKSIQKGKLDLLKKSGALQASIESISDLVEFSLDSVLEMADNESKKEQEVLDLLSESFSRSIGKVEDFQLHLSEMEKTFSELTDLSASEFNSNLYSLTINENIYEIRFRFTKAKAKATTKELKSRAFEKIETGLHWVKGKANHGLEYLFKGFEKIQTLYTRNLVKTSITTEVSNFLSKSESSIQQLPFVYQRLFKSEPVNDKAMFIGRADELNALENAYAKWDQARYAPTVVLGEKGSGLTSFVNYFIGTLKRKYPVVRINPSKRMYDENNFLTLLGDLLKQSFESTDQVIEHLNGLTTKRIFLIEDLQKFYLRKVDGFSCLSQIKRIITSTNNNIFWIVNTTLYTWEYLDKSTRIGDFFEYKIRLSDMTADQITEIISKRNKISGYYIEFEIPEGDTASSKLNKLTKDEIQEMYRNKFFYSLNKFTDSNIAISLLYWQLSVKEVTEDTIKILYFQQPDLSFISYFDKINLFVLQAIILHDGLTPLELSMVINNSEGECQLLLLSLLEDGILKKRDEVYLLNPLIYRQTVSLLKSQNLLF